ncbi:MAG TPA: hypothetical protein HA257_08465 [Candidatus Methanoperedenaceae archaeon]|nr:hypothetical protein [Candidatus Methanoperedenaceae archaeon]
MTDVAVSNKQIVFGIDMDNEYDVPVGVYRLLLYAFSLITPVGLALGVYYAVKGDDGNRFGRNCIKLALVPLAIILAVLGYSFFFFRAKYGL